MDVSPATDPLPILVDRGPVAQLMRGLDSSRSPLGPPSEWCASLQSVVSLMIDSRFPMFVAWGDELCLLYNDAYAAILGEKHPAALGQPFKQVWHEIWDDLETLVAKALAGQASWLEDLPLTMNRYGYDEATWFTFSYSPVRDETGKICGLYCACHETTQKVLAMRSIQAERERLESLFAQAPGFMAMVSEPSHTFRYANAAYRRLIGDRPLIGLSVREALPELDGQGFYELLDRVFEGGEPFIGKQQPLQIQRIAGGPIEQAYVDFIYQPIKDASDTVTGIFVEGYDVTEQTIAKERLENYANTLETLNRIGAALSSELDLNKIVQRVTDAGVALTSAQFGAFFYNTVDSEGENLTLYCISGAKASQFDGFGHPRATEVFKPTFDGTEIVRSDDITSDPRYGKNDPHFGLPKHHLPVRSYLAVPVRSRSGGAIGGLFFGHEKAGMFSDAHEELVAGIAAQAAIAFDNAQLYREAQVEIAQRKQIEARQVLLINELNHRVKNTLAIVQGLAQQSFKADLSMETAKAAFGARLNALAAAHTLLTRQNWEKALLLDVVRDAVDAAAGEASARVDCRGPDVVLPPQTAVTWAMAIHELCTNAIKYGALSNERGTVTMRWTVTADRNGKSRLEFEWTEAGGPEVNPPSRKGFGSRMIERALAYELQGEVSLQFEASGVRCSITTQLPEPA